MDHFGCAIRFAQSRQASAVPDLSSTLFYTLREDRACGSVNRVERIMHRSTNNRCSMNTQEKGKIAELLVEIRAYELGYIVSRPTRDCRYDLIIDDGEKLHRVQVKYVNKKCTKSTGSVLVDLRRWAGDKRWETRNYHSSEIDVLVVYIPAINKLCWIPISEIDDKPSFTIRYEPCKNNQSCGVHTIEEFLW